MKYGYYKDKYRSISIKLDQVKDADVIDFLTGDPDRGPKAIICGLVRDEIIARILFPLMKDPEVESDG